MGVEGSDDIIIMLSWNIFDFVRNVTRPVECITTRTAKVSYDEITVNLIKVRLFQDLHDL